jgi:hypothetical protein
VQAGERNIVKIKLTGDEITDKLLANKLAGLKSKPEFYTWHHLDDFDPNTGTCTMQLVETKIHRACSPHIGSVKLAESYHNFKYLNR